MREGAEQVAQRDGGEGLPEAEACTAATYRMPVGVVSRAGELSDRWVGLVDRWCTPLRLADRCCDLVAPGPPGCGPGVPGYVSAMYLVVRYS